MRSFCLLVIPIDNHNSIYFPLSVVLHRCLDTLDSCFVLLAYNLNTHYLEPHLDFYLVLLKIIEIICKAFATSNANGVEKYLDIMHSNTKKVVSELSASIMSSYHIPTKEKTLSNLKVSLELLYIKCCLYA